MNDLQHAEQQTVIYSSVYGGGNGFYLNKDNLAKTAVVFSVRRLIKPTWLNDRDQFLQPLNEPSEEFYNDCLVWMLFNRCNRTASADNLEWDNKKWSIVNHFIPYTESEVGSPERFESDFMVRYMEGKVFSVEAQQVLDAGRDLWRKYFDHNDSYGVREEFKLNRADVSWYQVRKALSARSLDTDLPLISFDSFEKTYKGLTDKLAPLVYELGFLKL